MKHLSSLKFICIGILLVGIAFGWQAQRRSNATQIAHVLDTQGTPIAFMSDNQTLAVGFEDAIELWNAQTGNLERTINLSKKSAGTGVFSPDSKIWASAKGYELKGKGQPNTVTLFDMKTGAVLRTLVGSGNAPVGGGLISTLAFSPDGKILAGASSDYTTRLWDVKTGNLLRTLRGHSAGVWVLAFAPDGKTLATASGSTGPEVIRLWDVGTGKIKKTLKEPVGPTGLVFLADNKTLLSLCFDGALHRWDVITGISKTIFQGDSYLNNPNKFTSDGKYYATGTWATGLTEVASGESEVRQTKTGGLVCKATKGIGTLDSVVLSTDGNLLATWGTEYKAGDYKLKICRTK